MKYDKAFFDEPFDRRGTACEKWDCLEERQGREMNPMWVADMDFRGPEEITEALVKRAMHPAYGYTAQTKAATKAMLDFMQRRHGVKLEEREQTLMPCVVTGLRAAVLALTKPGDGIIIQPPVYGPFYFSIKDNERKTVECPLIRDEKGYYTMDLAAGAAQLQAGAKLMLLCSPHNPASRAWTKDELTALIELLDKYNVPLVSDEIHADFVYAPGTFIPVLSLTQKNVMSFCAASKTFNLAGLQQACCICPDENIRNAFRHEMDKAGVRSGNIFALEATRAAYNEGDAWLDGLLDYLDGNRHHLAKLVAEYLPKAVLTPLEATYLGWIDLRTYGFNEEELVKRTLAAGVMFTGGKFFGDNGEGFLRINIGCPRRYITEGIHRLAMALRDEPGATNAPELEV